MKKTLLTIALACLCSGAWAQQATTNELEKFAPPMTPHSTAQYLPITASKNACTMCHRPGMEGQQKMKGMPTALPPSHVTDGKVAPNRYECMLCHAEVIPEKK